VVLTRISDRPHQIPDPPSDIEGPRLRLRAMAEADAGPNYVRWMNDPDIVRYTESRFTDHTIEDIRRYIRATRDDPNSLLLAMVITNDQRHIGNIKIGPVDWHHRTGDIGLLIGNADCWGQGYASEAIAALAGYAFTALGLEKLTAGVYAPNVGCIRAFERAGFTREGVCRSQYRFEDSRIDVVLVGRARGDGA
jgi:RimJ/RimL family protein N-acetyltransferase